jgi:hypothetical protein
MARSDEMPGIWSAVASRRCQFPGASRTAGVAGGGGAGGVCDVAGGGAADCGRGAGGGVRVGVGEADAHAANAMTEAGISSERFTRYSGGNCSICLAQATMR